MVKHINLAEISFQPIGMQGMVSCVSKIDVPYGFKEIICDWYALHLGPSRNAPKFRRYTERGDEASAGRLVVMVQKEIEARKPDVQSRSESKV